MTEIRPPATFTPAAHLGPDGPVPTMDGRLVVLCDADCQAFELPRTIEEYQAALVHLARARLHQRVRAWRLTCCG